MGIVEKIERMIRLRNTNQGVLEQQAALSVNRISKWKGGTGEPTARQALRIARILDVPLEWLIDDEIDELMASNGTTLDEDEAFVLQLYRDLGITREEAVRRLAGQVTIEAMEPPKIEAMAPPVQKRRGAG